MITDSKGAVTFEGLPQRFVYPINNFRDEEIRADPLAVLQSVIKADEDHNQVQPQEEIGQDDEEDKNDMFDRDQLPTRDLPSETIAEKRLFFQLLKEDPSKYYDIIERIGVGGFAKVFKVKRKDDDAICALKFVEPKTP